jgi:branched-chain amino acid transport system permease protein
MALALVLVFSVTRVIFIPQGEFVAFGALSMAMMQAGKVPATLWLLALAVATLVVEAWRHRAAPVEWAATAVWTLALPALAAALVLLVKPHRCCCSRWPRWPDRAAGPLLYRWPTGRWRTPRC